MTPAFLQAAASYFGVNPEQVAGSDWHNADGQLVVSFEFNVTEDDLVGIVDRMKVLKAEMPAPEPEPQMEPVDLFKLRGEWNTMDKPARRAYGSFEGYVAMSIQAKSERKISVPAYVLLSRGETTELQRSLSSTDPATGKYMVQFDDLTDEQRNNLQD